MSVFLANNMSLGNRPNSLFKRAEQLKQWEESDTNRESSTPKGDRRNKVRFPAGCVFLAACAAADHDEVQRLLQNGADIDTANIDGLTALHQACIDNDLEMVEFLLPRGADVNCRDNEGWTPLHAAASCGFLSIARLLIERGADVAAVNNDGELPVDISESDDMEFLLLSHITAQGIDPDAARSKEERLMLADAKEWLNSGQVCDKPHPKTGATALHVAAAKGYIKVMNILLQAGADVNTQDLDGWTALHAAAHWAQREACELLVESLIDMDLKNYVGQTAEDVADSEMLPHLKELRKKQAILLRGRAAAILPSKRPSSGTGLQQGGTAAPGNKRRSLDSTPVPPLQGAMLQGNNLCATNNNNPPSSVTRMSAGDRQGLVSKDVSAERNTLLGHDDVAATESEETTTTTTTSTSEESEIEKRNRANRGDTKAHSIPQAPSSPPRPPIDSDESGIPSWRRPGSFRGRSNGGSARLEQEPTKPASNRPGDRDSVESNPEVVLRRTHSFEADDSFYRKYRALQERIKATSCPVLTRTPPLSTLTNITVHQLTAVTSASKPGLPERLQHSEKLANSAPVSPARTPGTLHLPGQGQVRRSFVPPVRDEESETQRKAHAKRVRETRRSTQGVTLEEIKSAEQLVKAKKQQAEPTPQTTTTTTVTPASPTPKEEERVPEATVTTEEPTEEPSAGSKAERRPSWRLKFLLEDARGVGSTATTNDTSSTTSSYVRRGSASTRPVENNIDNSVTVALRRPAAKIIAAPPEDKDQDKENDSRSAQATQAVIQRRRRPKRRSTGVVHFDMDEVDPERQDGNGDNDEAAKHTEESDRSGRSSRLSSVSSSGGVEAEDSAAVTQEDASTENGDLDYKKLYEESRVENERLRLRLRRVEDELRDSKSEKQSGAKSSMSEAEKRERRAMERKLSEMEEELKIMETLKKENQKLKDENGALIRVISKLSK